MPYDATIKQEASFVSNLSLTEATEDKFHATYSGILAHWFPPSLSYLIEPQVRGEEGKPGFIVVRHGGGYRSPLLIVELKRVSKWNDAGRKAVRRELTLHLEGRFDLTRYNTIYGLGGIGFHWMVCKMEKSGSGSPVDVEPWRDDIVSDASYNRFEEIADLIYNIS